MTKSEIIKYLVKECHLSIPQIFAMNDLQIGNLCKRHRWETSRVDR